MPVNLVSHSYPGREGIIQTVIYHMSQEPPDHRNARLLVQRKEGLYRAFHVFRNVVGLFSCANCGKSGKLIFELLTSRAGLKMTAHFAMPDRRNLIPHIIYPISDIEMAHSFRH